MLFDLGALHHSYISAHIVEEHKERRQSMIRPYEAWVKLADQRTVLKTEIIQGVLPFGCNEGAYFSVEVDACVTTCPMYTIQHLVVDIIYVTCYDA